MNNSPTAATPTFHADADAAFKRLLSNDVDSHVSSPEYNGQPAGNPLPVVVVVAARESLVGCHSFAEFLSPDFETLFVFEKRFAEQWHLEKLVKGASTQVSRRAQLFMLPAWRGEVHARRLALRYMETLDPVPKYMFSNNCDMHPLRQTHVRHLPFDRVVRGLYDASEEEKARRGPGGAGTIVEDTHPRSERDWGTFPIFSMSPLLLEAVPRDSSLYDAKFHGRDVGHWEARHGKKPSTIQGPWISDVHSWVECHSVLMDVPMLQVLDRENVLQLDSLTEEDRVLPPLFHRHNWTAVRHNDIALMYDLQKPERWRDFNGNNFRGVDLDAVRLSHLRLMSHQISPKACFASWQKVRRLLNITTEVFCNGYVGKHYADSWLPPSVSDSPVGNSLTRQVLVFLFRLLGYERVKFNGPLLVFEIKRILPHTFCIAPSHNGTAFMQLTDLAGSRVLTLKTVIPPPCKRPSDDAERRRDILVTQALRAVQAETNQRLLTVRIPFTLLIFSGAESLRCV